MPLNFNTGGKSRVPTVLLLVFLAVSVVLMTVYVREGGTGPLHAVQAEVTSVLSPLEFLGASGGAAVDGAADAFGDATADSGTLSELKDQNAELKELLTQAEEYRLEAERLEGLLNLKETYKIEGVSGRVIGRSTDAWSQTITIDVGSSDGVEVGLTVVGPSGVVGQVVSVSAGSATVRLLSDPQSGVASMVQSSRAEGVVRGSLSGLLYLENIGEDVSVSVGDAVLTSGLGGSYTKGLLIGTVVRVEGSVGDDAREIVVAQNESIGTLEEVIVVFSASETSDGSSSTNLSASADNLGTTSQGDDSTGEGE